MADPGVRIAALVDGYCTTARDVAGALAETAPALAAGGWRDAGAMGILADRVHKLSGSGGSMGFPALGRLANALEILLRRVLDTGEDPGTGPAALLDLLAALLAAEAAAIQPEESGLITRLAERDAGMSPEAPLDPPARVVVALADPVLAAYAEALLHQADCEILLVAPGVGADETAWFEPDLCLTDSADVEGGSAGDRLLWMDGRALERLVAAGREPAAGLLPLTAGPGLLVRTVTARVREARTRSDAAERDGASGLFHAAALRDRMARDLARVARTGQALTVMHVTFPHWRRTCRERGLSAADAARATVVETLRETLPRAGTLGLLAPDHLVACLPGVGEAGPLPAVPADVPVACRTVVAAAGETDPERLLFG